jgi:hypothetical protein
VFITDIFNKQKTEVENIIANLYRVVSRTYCERRGSTSSVVQWRRRRNMIGWCVTHAERNRLPSCSFNKNYNGPKMASDASMLCKRPF